MANQNTHEMDDIETLAKMIMTFRICDLQLLMSTTSLTKCKNKKSLQSIALRALRDKNPISKFTTTFHEKIRTINKCLIDQQKQKKRGGRSKQGSSQDNNVPQVESVPPPMANAVVTPQPILSSHYPTPEEQDRIVQMSSQWINPKNNEVKFKNGERHPVGMNQIPLEDIQLHKLLCIASYKEIVKPTYLDLNNWIDERHKVLQDSVNFSLKACDIERLTDPMSPFKLCLRFTLCSYKGECPDIIVPKATVCFNGHHFYQKKLHSIRGIHGLDLTAFINHSPNANNILEMMWFHSPMNIAYTIQVVETATCKQLLNHLIFNSKESLHRSIARTNDILSRHKSSGNACTIISRSCPINMRKIKYPTRGKHCTHVQCFDALNYIELNALRASSACPICKVKVGIQDMFIDTLQVKILQRIRNSSNDLVKIRENGVWESCIPIRSNELIETMPANEPVTMPANEPVTRPATEPVTRPESRPLISPGEPESSAIYPRVQVSLATNSGEQISSATNSGEQASSTTNLGEQASSTTNLGEQVSSNDVVQIKKRKAIQCVDLQ